MNTNVPEMEPAFFGSRDLGLLIQCGGADINYAANVACLKVQRDQQYTMNIFYIIGVIVVVVVVAGFFGLHA